MRSLLSFIALAFALLAAVGHSSPLKLPPFAGTEDGQLFSLEGSNTVGARLAPELARDYMLAKGLVDVAIHETAVENEYRVIGYHPQTQRAFVIKLAAHGSSTAFAGLNAGTADIGMASRAIKDAEVEGLRSFGDMRSFEAEKVVAIDGLAVIVHPQNPVSELTLDQIARIFSGDIDNWQQVGGIPGPINRYARDNKSGTWDTFKSLVLRKQHSLDAEARRFESNDEISALVQRDTQGIGFVGLASVAGAKALAVSDTNTRALMPTLLTVATEDYLLSRRLFLYVKPQDQSPLVREFLTFAQSEAGQSRVSQVGYVAQNPIPLPPPNLQLLQESYARLVEGGERLSVNIRFKEGSAQLDNKALQDIQRLSRFMQQPEQQDRKLLLIGFGDAKQTQRRAQVLSELRALTVRSALRDYGLTTLPVEGLGADLPVADNNSDSRLRNQRVEIWLI